jgi:signal transduction histidine kinase
VLGVVCVVAALALGMFVRARRQLALIERERAASEQELRVAQARQMERNRIAREMHDVLAHRLSLLSLQAGALELGPDAPPAEVARTAGVIRINAHGALEDGPARGDRRAALCARR